MKTIFVAILFIITVTACEKDPRASDQLAPSNLTITSVSNITESSADISFSYKKNSKYSEPGYYSVYILFSDGSESSPYVQDYTAHVIDLKAGTTYEARVKLANSGGAVISNSVTFTTKKSSK